MNANEVRSNEATGDASVAGVDMKLEVVVIPVSDVDRAKEFYSRLGWRLDADHAAGSRFRLVQFTPPGSRQLSPIRRKPHVGCARFGPRPAPDRLRHRVCPR
jgi:catechol 2,3-dioxygenase-like lactoylglutathione lyase family enzyme